MHRFALGLVAVVAVTGPAAAEGRITAGIGLGLTHSEADALDGAEPNSTVGLWGRLRLGSRISAQLELTRIKADDGADTYGYSDPVAMRQVSALLVVDLARSGKSLVPIALVGAGIDNEVTTYSDKDFVHALLGAGLEYRAANGLTIGADLRMGTRTSSEPQYKTQPVQEGVLFREAPSRLAEGEFRTARLTVGIRF